MRISQVYPVNYHQNRTISTNQINPSFRSMKNFDEFSVMKANPIIRYANNMFKKSLVASNRRIQPLETDLRDKTREIVLRAGKKETTYGWDIQNGNSKKYILYLHGASQNITNVQPLYSAIIKNTDYSIFALEYRGFGKNPPKTVNSNTFLEDTISAVEYLEKEKSIKPEDIVVIGHSMGGYTASQIAENRKNLGRLILVAPLGSVSEQPLDVNVWFAKRMPKFVRFLFKNFKFLRTPLENFFKTEKYLKNIQTPIDIIHSENDRLLRPASSVHMSKVCQNLRSLKILPRGGHKMESEKINAIISLLNS